jgi:hypothetical protein
MGQQATVVERETELLDQPSHGLKVVHNLGLSSVHTDCIPLGGSSLQLPSCWWMAVSSSDDAKMTLCLPFHCLRSSVGSVTGLLLPSSAARVACMLSSFKMPLKPLSARVQGAPRTQHCSPT